MWGRQPARLPISSRRRSRTPSPTFSSTVCRQAALARGQGVEFAASVLENGSSVRRCPPTDLTLESVSVASRAALSRAPVGPAAGSSAGHPWRSPRSSEGWPGASGRLPRWRSPAMLRHRPCHAAVCPPQMAPATRSAGVLLPAAEICDHMRPHAPNAGEKVRRDRGLCRLSGWKWQGPGEVAFRGE